MSITTEALKTEFANTQANAAFLESIPERFKQPFAKAIETNKLELEHLKVTDAQIQNYVVYFLNSYPKIKHVSLLNNEISNDGVVALMQNQGITYLNLGRNKIGDTGMIALAEHLSIHWLNLLGNPGITKPGVIKLHTALKENKMLTDLHVAHSSTLHPLLLLNFQYKRLAPEEINTAFVTAGVDMLNRGVDNIVYAYLGLETFKKKNHSKPMLEAPKRTKASIDKKHLLMPS